ncbi:hypothetical protein NQD34_002296 [Periophthalmus magnuspinnatus]|nr:hypothetical protein NQD34_002296 [Periophthalmus magnuspinnatus]
MDEAVKHQLQENGRRYQRSLERIAEKYSKIQQYGDDAIEVDFNNTHIETLQHYMTLSKKNVDTFSKGFADLKEKSLSLQNSRESQVDYTYKERTDCFETICLSDDDIENEATNHTVNPLDESLRNYTVMSDQPEDQDEQLEMSLRSQGSSLVDLYPNMISQIGEAWRRQHVSNVADSVVRRYRRWHKSNRTPLTNSFHIPQRPKNQRRRDIFNKQHHNPKSPVKTLSSTIIKAGSPSPVKTATNGQKSQYYCSLMKRKEVPATPIVMESSAFSEQHGRELNKTFTVYEPSLSYSTYTSSPSSSYYLPNRLSQDISFRMKESCVSPCHMQGNCSGYAAENSLFKERHETYSSPVRQSPHKSRLASRNTFSEQIDIYGSPVRKSPFKLHTSRESPRQSPYAHVASPKSSYMKQSISREERSRFNSASNCVSSMSPKITLSRRNLDYSDLRLSTQLASPQMGTSGRQHHGLRRCLSFDSSSLTLNREPYTTKDLDNDFTKLYHKLVCLNKSMHLQGHPCRFCVKNSETSRGHSVNNLAALALSPHRPLLRKRHRDLDSYPQSKRFKDGL